MNKNLKYLFIFSVLSTFIFSGNSVFATGQACGVSSQGICKVSCDPYDEIYTGDLTKSGSICATSPEGIPEQCCVSTKCVNNNIGFGTCKSASSCDYGSVGINTSDCTPPKLCCVLPKASGMEVGNEISSPITTTNTETNNVFTNEQNQSSGSTGTGLVPCSGMDCSVCDIFKLIQNLINFFIELVFALAGGFMVWGAVEIMIAGGDEKKVSSGRGRMTIAVYGVAITLGAWLLVGTVLQVLTNSSSKIPWNKITCSSAPLTLPRVDTGSDAACANQNGQCQDVSIAPCGTGTHEVSGLCLSVNSLKNKNTQCCVPDIVPKVVECSSLAGGTYACTQSECPGNELISGNCGLGHCCPKTNP